MALTRDDCIQAVMNAGVSAHDAVDAVDFMLAEKARLKAAGQPVTQGALGKAFASKIDDVRRERARLKRLADFAILRRVERENEIDAKMRDGATFKDALMSLLVGSNDRFFGARNSISMQRKGILNGITDPMFREMKEVGGDGKILDRIRDDKGIHDDVIREMRQPGITGNKDAAEFAQIWARHTEELRQRYNAAGGEVGKLDGWVPQSHDFRKLLDKGRDQWINDIIPLLDLDRTFEGVNTMDEVREILSGVYDTLTLGKNRWLDDDPFGTQAAYGERVLGPANQAGKFRAHRVLHFKDGDAAVKYNDTYGRGNVFDAMMFHIDQMTRATSILESLGPAPMRTLDSLIEREESRIRTLSEAIMPQKEKRKHLEDLRSLAARGNLMRQGSLVNIVAELTGEANCPVSPTLARVGSSIRAVNSLSMLGGAAISAVSDIFTKALGMRVNGASLFEGIQRSLADQLRIYGDGTDARIAAGQGGAFLDQITRSIASRWDAEYTTPGLLSDLQNKMFKWTGLTWITEHGKAGFTMWLSSHLGELHATEWADIDPSRRAMLEYHGVDDARWNIYRKMMREADDGATYFLPVEADSIPLEEFAALLPDSMKNQWGDVRRQELERIRNRVRTDALAMLADETNYAIIEPDDATRAVMRQGTRPGTAAGEIWRCVMQFKSFPIAYMQRILGGRRWVRGERQRGMARGFGADTNYGLKTLSDALGRDIPGVIGSTLTALAFGYAAMTLKDISRGRTPRDPYEPETILAAALQSGGLGIFGDYIFAQTGRYGGSLAGALAGPTASTLLDGYGKIPSMLIRGNTEDAADQMIRTTLSTVPFMNMWMIRTPLDFLLTHHIREALSPGYLERMESRAESEFGQGFLVKPTDYIRPGGGFW